MPGGTGGKPVQKLEGEGEDRNICGDGPQTEGRSLRPAPAQAQRHRAAASRRGPSQPVTAPQTPHLPAPPHSAPWGISTSVYSPQSRSPRSAPSPPLPKASLPPLAPRTPPSWHHMRGGHHQRTARPLPTAMQAHACGRSHLGGPEIRGLGSTSVSSGGYIALGDMGLYVIMALWSPPQAGRQRRPGPLCRLGDGGTVVPSAGRETESLWSPLQAGRWRRCGPLHRSGDRGSLVPSAGQEMEALWSLPQVGRLRHRGPLCRLGDGGGGPGQPGLPLHSAPAPPPEPEADTWDPLRHPRDWQPVTPESSRVNTGGIFLCCPHVLMHRRSKAIVKRSKIPPLGKKEKNRSPQKQPTAANKLLFTIQQYAKNT